MKKLTVLAMILAPAMLLAQKKAPSTYDLVIGTYTKGKSQGIQVYRFYTETGKLAYLSQVPTSNPSYVTVSNDNKFVYAVNEDGKDGGVSAFKFDANTGVLTFINKQSSQGADPCYIAVDKAKKNLLVANYSSGNLTVLPVNKDGSVSAVSQNLQDEGKGPNASRQEKAHVHMGAFTPDEKFVLYTDLGIDKVNVARYKANAEKPLQLLPQNAATVMGGHGPRHFVFSNDRKFVYLVTEMGSQIYSYKYDDGKLKQIQSVTMLPDGFSGDTGAAAIKISPDGRFLYASNRGAADDIVIYSINKESGMLTYVDRVSSLGNNPRDFAIDPTGNFLLVANQDSDNIVVYKINQSTGKLTLTATRVDIGNPVCLKFTSAQ
ncbi:lactonase family protein [Mucilaginibacter sp. KACC 22063]|uniref:lactonase family protein n=1 Tax=Mucilaginibacter sp. KACC 22063 TaxID=3025666 RepID=UPI002366AB5B|nr:lactonase family protein [Mucilaginibacter sp. KACC 22063]WDF56004.1 lactonase family protein [Mucilaginibacter sp. KACC 22063]